MKLQKNTFTQADFDPKNFCGILGQTGAAPKPALALQYD
jgi:hypothetical protein